MADRIWVTRAELAGRYLVSEKAVESWAEYVRATDLASLRAENERINIVAETRYKEIESLYEQRTQLRADLERMRTALEPVRDTANCLERIAEAFGAKAENLCPKSGAENGKTDPAPFLRMYARTINAHASALFDALAPLSPHPSSQETK